MVELVELIERGIVYEWDEVDRVILFDEHQYNAVRVWVVSEATFKSGEYKNIEVLKDHYLINALMCDLYDAADIVYATNKVSGVKTHMVFMIL
jgi:hypothetical protein